MKDKDVRLNVISLDFANEMGEEEEEEGEFGETQLHADESMADITGPKTKKDTVQETETQTQNKEMLVHLTERIKGAIFPASIAMSIYQQFKKKEVMARKKFQGNLDLAEDLKLGVQIFSRTKEELVPTLKKFSKMTDYSTTEGTGKVKLERTYTEIDDPDQKVVDAAQ